MVDSSFEGTLWWAIFVEWILLPAVGRFGGILMMWDPRVVVVRDNMIGDLSVSIEIVRDDEFTWWFSGIYGPSRPREREKFWDEIAGLRVICGARFFLGGDFNVVRTISEKLNSLTITSSMCCFDALITKLELHDPSLLKNRK